MLQNKNLVLYMNYPPQVLLSYIDGPILSTTILATIYMRKEIMK